MQDKQALFVAVNHAKKKICLSYPGNILASTRSEKTIKENELKTTSYTKYAFQSRSMLEEVSHPKLIIDLLDSCFAMNSFEPWISALDSINCLLSVFILLSPVCDRDFSLSKSTDFLDTDGRLDAGALSPFFAEMVDVFFSTSTSAGAVAFVWGTLAALATAAGAAASADAEADDTLSCSTADARFASVVDGILASVVNDVFCSVDIDAFGSRVEDVLVSADGGICALLSLGFSCNAAPSGAVGSGSGGASRLVIKIYCSFSIYSLFSKYICLIF